MFQVTDSIYDLVGAEIPAKVKNQNIERVFANMDTDKVQHDLLVLSLNFDWQSAVKVNQS